MRENFQNIFQIFAKTNFCEETYLKYFVKIKIRECREKGILPVVMFFRMRLDASVCKANKKQIKETGVRIRTFLSFFSYY